MDKPADENTFVLPMTIGHECAGVVAALGAGALGVREGDAVAVYGAWGCGYCRTCSTGAENYCENQGTAEDRLAWPRGAGSDGRVHARTELAAPGARSATSTRSGTSR